MKLSKHTIGNILKEYEKGDSISTLALRYKVTDATVGYHLHKYGVKVRPRGGYYPRHVKRSSIAAPKANIVIFTPAPRVGFFGRLRQMFA